jgi:hypothetical protein
VPDLDDVRAEILSTATEDLNGVWEAWWSANGLLPALPLSARLALAEEALRSLIAEGLVRLSCGSWEMQAEVPPGEVESLLRQHDTWVASPDHDLVFFAATPKGVASYGLGAD